MKRQVLEFPLNIGFQVRVIENFAIVAFIPQNVNPLIVGIFEEVLSRRQGYD